MAVNPHGNLRSADSVATLRIVRAENDLLFDEHGNEYIDLFSANGTAWMGHANPVVAAAVARQLEEIWTSGALTTPAREAALAAVESYLPVSHRAAGLYSTGMEAAEFALRMTRSITGRRVVIGFNHHMHGKSLATAALGWENDWNLATAEIVRLPFVDQATDDAVLASLASRLQADDVAAVFVEPILGSHGGHAATPAFYEAVHQLCRRHEALLVFDEILTGFHRTGPPFFFSGLSFVPDAILVGKGLGGGFPVSGVVLDRKYSLEPRMLPGSTFAGNALAAAAVSATLAHMRTLDVPRRVASISSVLEDALSPLAQVGVAVRGRGALWVLEVPSKVDMACLAESVYRRGVAVGYAGRFVRLLPAATIRPEKLDWACRILAEELRAVL